MSDKIIDINESRIKTYIEENRPPVEIRNELDIGYTYDGKTIEIFEIRPQWNDPSNILKLPYAKIKYIGSKKIWKLYWIRANGKWYAYDPLPESTHLAKLLECIDADSLGCFRG